MDISARRRWIFRVLTVFGSVLAVLLVAEFALRAKGFHPIAFFSRGRKLILRRSALPDVLYEAIPGARARAWNTEVSINSAGFRGPEIERAKGERRRLVVLGDSVSFANGIPYEDAYPVVLERALRNSAPQTQVLNFALGGYDVLQEVALLEHRALAFEPDVVILGYCLNDVGIASPNLLFIELYESYRSNFLLRLRTVQYLMVRIERHRLFFEHLNDPQRFAASYRDRIDPLGPDEHALRALMARAAPGYPMSWYQSPDRVGRLRYALRRLRALADAQGFRVIIALVPWLTSRDGQYPHQAVHDIVAYEAARAGHELLDLTPHFLAAGIEELRLNPTDLCHPSAAGHALIAEQLEAALAAPAPPRENR